MKKKIELKGLTVTSFVTNQSDIKAGVFYMEDRVGDDTIRLICTAQACTNYCTQYC
ncbi:MAG: hypothetical protein WBB45_14825 [Cyclobacteriaceae bacterium]